MSNSEGLSTRHPEFQEDSQHNRLIVVSGVSGCGKDYLLGKAVASNLESHIKLFPFGELLYRQLKSLNTSTPLQTTGRDQLKDTFTQDQLAEQIIFIAQNIINEQPGIVNTHLVYRQQTSLIVNPEIIAQLNPKVIIFIGADPDDVCKWRKEPGRKRDIESPNYISFFQGIEREVAKRFAEFLGSKFVEIINSPDIDSINANIGRLKQLISEI